MIDPERFARSHNRITKVRKQWKKDVFTLEYIVGRWATWVNRDHPPLADKPIIVDAIASS